MWKAMDQHVQVSCGLSYKEETPITLYEDNAACIVQLKGEYIFLEVFLHAWSSKQGDWCLTNLFKW